MLPVVAKTLVEVIEVATKLFKLVRPMTARLVVVALDKVVAPETDRLVPVAEVNEVRFKTVRPETYWLVVV